LNDFYIPEPTPPKPLSATELVAFDIEIDALIRAPQARTRFQVDGAGLCAAVLDTGLRATHECFSGRVVPGGNFTTQDNGDKTRVDDYNGHGTNVAGIIVGGTNDARRGIAPGAKVVPLKVLPGGMEGIVKALEWVRDNQAKHQISVANMSLGVPDTNFIDDAAVAMQQPRLVSILSQLRAMHVPVVIAAGNDYFRFQTEGMSFPAILRQSFAVGAVYDASVGERNYGSGASAFVTQADQFTPFSQRLSQEVSPECYTDIFGPGASATSAGHRNDNDTSVQDGTSQAAPTIAGVILLLQQFYRRTTGALPPVDLLSDCLRSSGKWLVDADVPSVDNVRNSGRTFPRVDAFQALATLHKKLQLRQAGFER
jgi:subtilisin family serine protease